jgi:small-conductance mechanosensitive channel
MLSDSERRRLAEIESSLRADDPVFVQRFDARPRRRRAVVALLASIIAVTITLIALLRGNVAAALVGLAAAGLSVGLWATFRNA